MTDLVTRTQTLAKLRYVLTGMAAIGSDIAQAVLQHGVVWTVQSVAEEMSAGPDSERFMKAGTLAMHPYMRRLTYVEGYAMREHGLPVHHAWCVTEHGQVMDPSWPLHPQTAYLGIPIQREFMMQAVRERGDWGVLESRTACAALMTTPALAVAYNVAPPLLTLALPG